MTIGFKDERYHLKRTNYVDNTLKKVYVYGFHCGYRNQCLELKGDVIIEVRNIYKLT